MTLVGRWASAEATPAKVAEGLASASSTLLDKALGTNLKVAAPIQAKELAARGRDLYKLGQFSDAYDTFEAALLLDPQNFELHCITVEAPGSLWAPNFPGPRRNRSSMAKPTGTSIPRNVSLPSETQTGFGGLALLEFIYERAKLEPNGRSEKIPDLRQFVSFAPPDDVQEWFYRTLKYRFENGDPKAPDSFASLGYRVVTEANSLEQQRQYTLDERIDFLVRLAPVWKRGDVHLWQMFVGDIWHESPQLSRLLKALDESSNPVAHEEAALFRKKLEEGPPQAAVPATQTTAKQCRQRKRRLPSRESRSTFLIKFPTRSKGPSGGRPPSTTGRLPARRRISSAKNLASTVSSWTECRRKLPALPGYNSGLVYDGKYVWYAAVIDKVTQVVAYDPAADKFWTAGVARGSRPTRCTSRLPRRCHRDGSSWRAASDSRPFGSGSLNAVMDETKGPKCRVIHECREQEMKDVKHPSVDSVFELVDMRVMKGPPGAGPKAMPRVYLSRYSPITTDLLIDPGTSAFSSVPRSPNGRLWNGKLLLGCDQWDPATGKTQHLPSPTRSRFKYSHAFGDTMLLFDNEHIYGGKIGTALTRLCDIDKTLRSGVSTPDVQESSLFGLIYGRDTRI